ncbi:CoA-transferase [Streptomyces spiramenti]|nr:CoA-transferase [Streptomyces spiramenti]
MTVAPERPADLATGADRRGPVVHPDVDAMVAAHVRPGMHVHAAATLSRPNALIYALARQFAGTRSLTVSTTAVHSSAHALALSGAVRKMIACFLGDTYPSPRPNRLYKELAQGRPFELETWSLLSYTQRLIAGAQGLPWAVTGSLSGTDLADGKEGLLAPLPVQPEDPDAQRPGSLVRAMNPDLTLVHGAVADRRGNVVLLAPVGEGAWAAYAAKGGVLASVERIVPDEVIDACPDRVLIPGQRVVGLCEARLGAHPQSLRADGVAGLPGYRDDYAFIEEINERCATPEGAEDWYREWVSGVGSHEGYLRHLDDREWPSAPWPGGSAALDLPSPRVEPAGGTNDPTAADPDAAGDQQRMIVLGARAIVDRVESGGYDTLLAGIGSSHIAAWLAARLLAERGTEVQVCAELGFYGTKPDSGDVFLFSQLHGGASQGLSGIVEVLGGMVAGNSRRCLGVLAAGEIDQQGAINSSLLSNGRWLTGSGGANDIASSVDCLVVCEARPRRLVEKVAYVTSPGDRVHDVVCQFGRFRRESGAEDFRLTTWLPPVGDDAPGTPAEAVAALTAWQAEASRTDDEVPVTAHELALLRELDPDGHFR